MDFVMDDTSARRVNIDLLDAYMRIFCMLLTGINASDAFLPRLFVAPRPDLLPARILLRLIT